MWWALLLACVGSDVALELEDTELLDTEQALSDWDAGAPAEVEPKPGDWVTRAFADATEDCGFDVVGVEVPSMAPSAFVITLEDEEGFFRVYNEEHNAESVCEVRGTGFRCDLVDTPYQHPFGDNVHMAFEWQGIVASGTLTGAMAVGLECTSGCGFFENVGLTFPCTVEGDVQLELEG